MCVLQILYAISGIFVCESQDSTFGNYRDIRERNNYIFFQPHIPLNLVAVPLSDFICTTVMLEILTSTSILGYHFQSF